MPLEAGTQFAGYRMEHLLGQGGMGEVYLATHEVLGRKVALKLLAPALAHDATFRDRFLGESRTAASLEHPHVVTVYEAGEREGRLYLAMRHIDGEDLAAILGREGRLAPGRLIGLLAGVADALDAAHELGLVHRDVKPGNMLVGRGRDGREHAYLTDFGLVKRLTGDAAGLTRTGQFLGSVDYVPPEQVEGEELDGRADVYALAATAFHGLAGSPPYERSSEMATLLAHLHAPVPLLSERVPGLAALDPALQRGLAKDPIDRPATAAELIAELAAALDGMADVAGAASTAELPGRREADHAPADATAEPRSRSKSHAAALTPLVGRDDDIRTIRERLELSRLVTLTGPGGIGKTRLALAVADVLDAAVVDLTPITDADLLPTEITTVLGLRPSPGRPPIEALADALGDQPRVLMLDNLESMPIPELAPRIEKLLGRAPQLQLLATSRTPIGIPGEAEYVVQPLATPGGTSPAELEASPGGALLLQRARAIGALDRIEPDDAADLVALCRQLDGIPLALELAAAQLRVYSPAEIRQALASGFGLLADPHRPEKQRSLDATIQWSLDLLEPAQRSVLTAAAVFAGTFDVGSLRALLPDDATAANLNALVSIGLVRAAGVRGGKRRFALLETIRAAASQQTDPATRAALREGHAWTFGELVRQRGGRLDGPDHAAHPELLDDRDNIRLAFEWAVDHDVDLALELVGRLQGYWFNLGALDEGADWADRVAKLPGGDPALRLHAASTGLQMKRMRSMVGLDAAARRLFAAAETAADPAAAVRAMSVAMAVLDWSDPEAAERDDRAIATAEAAGLVAWLPNLLSLKGMAVGDLGDAAGSMALLERAAAIAVEVGDHDSASIALGNLAVQLEETDPERAIEVNRQALAAVAGHGVPIREAWIAANQAELLARQHHPGLGTAELAASIKHNLANPGDHIVEFTLASTPIVMLRTGHPELGLRASALVEHLHAARGRVLTLAQAQQDAEERAALLAVIEPARAAEILRAAPSEKPELLLRDVLAVVEEASVA